MFEPLPTILRLRRVQRNLTLDALAALAGVSRRQLALVEAGENVSLKFLLKVATALELTELPVGELRLRAAPPELASIARAADVLAQLKQTAHQWAVAAGQIDDASTSLDEILGRAMGPGHSGRDIEESAERLASALPAEHRAAADMLRSLSRSEPVANAPRPKRATPTAARRERR